MKTAILIAVVVLGLHSGMAYANALPNYSAEQKLAESDAVVIGQVRQITRNPADSSEYAIIDVSTALKGLVPRTIEIETKGAISESNFTVMVGSNYTFYLRKIGDGKYISIAGRNGVALYDPAHPFQ